MIVLETKGKLTQSLNFRFHVYKNLWHKTPFNNKLHKYIQNLKLLPLLIGYKVFPGTTCG